MIERFARSVDPDLNAVSGKVFYSGREAFRPPADLYVVGFNPGGDPNSLSELTVGESVDFVVHHAPPRWSAYCDESWLERPAGQMPLQRRIQHLFAVLQVDLRRTPSSNLIFTRSQRIANIAADRHELEALCWPFHAAVIADLKPRGIVCLGRKTGLHVRRRLGANALVSRFRERNNRGWESLTHQMADGLLVFTLSHPSVADWANPSTDPSPMVRHALKNAT